MCSSMGGHHNSADSSGIISIFVSLFFKFFTVCVIYRIFKACEPLARIVKVWYIYPLLGRAANYEKYVNKWTVVTGCTDGIGKCYTMELAKRGFKKFLLIGRNAGKLSLVEKELKEKYGVKEVETHVFDFDTSNYDGLPLEKLQNYKIGLLVNCCGIAVENLVKWTSQPLGEPTRIMRVNAMSAVKMTELVLPNMVEADVGIIVSVSSIQGWRPLPLLATYPASKAAVSFMSQCLSLEYGDTNVAFQCLIPMLVATKMTHYDAKEADGWIVVSPENYAKDAVDALGIMPVGTGCKIHDIQVALILLFPHSLVRYAMKPFYAYQAKRFRDITTNANGSSPK